MHIIIHIMHIMPIIMNIIMHSMPMMMHLIMHMIMHIIHIIMPIITMPMILSITMPMAIGSL